MYIYIFVSPENLLENMNIKSIKINSTKFTFWKGLSTL